MQRSLSDDEVLDVVSSLSDEETDGADEFKIGGQSFALAAVRRGAKAYVIITEIDPFTGAQWGYEV